MSQLETLRTKRATLQADLARINQQLIDLQNDSLWINAELKTISQKITVIEKNIKDQLELERFKL